MRTFSPSVSTRLLSSLHVYKVPSPSQQHRQGSHRIQVHTNQHPQVPTFRLVPCPTLPNTISTHFAQDEIQRVATKHVFQHCRIKKKEIQNILCLKASFGGVLVFAIAILLLFLFLKSSTTKNEAK